VSNILADLSPVLYRQSGCELTRCIVALSRLRDAPAGFISEWTEAATAQQASFGTVQLGMSVRALGRLNACPAPFTERSVSRIAADAQLVRGWVLGDALYALGVHRLQHPDFDVLANTAQTRVFNLDSLAFSSALFGIAVFDQDRAKQFFDSAYSQGAVPIPLRSDHLINLCHTLVAIGMEIPEEYRDPLEREFQLRRVNPPEPSRFEQEFAEALTRRGRRFEAQSFMEGYFVDFVVHTGASRMVGIELDGVRFHHINCDPRTELNGTSYMKDRFLERRGLEVVHLNDATWATIRSDKVKTAALIEQLLGARPA